MNQTEIEKVQKEITETRKAQQAVSFGRRGQNAAKFGAYERKLESLYRQLDHLRK